MKVKTKNICAGLAIFAVVSVGALFEIKFPIGCPAAMNCTDIRYCGLNGFISNTPIDVLPDKELYRMPLTDCRDPSKGLENGKCCRDPDYVDPWPSSTHKTIVNKVTSKTELLTNKVKRDCKYQAQRKYVSTRQFCRLL